MSASLVDRKSGTGEHIGDHRAIGASTPQILWLDQCRPALLHPVCRIGLCLFRLFRRFSRDGRNDALEPWHGVARADGRADHAGTGLSADRLSDPSIRRAPDGYHRAPGDAGGTDFAGAGRFRHLAVHSGLGRCHGPVLCPDRPDLLTIRDDQLVQYQEIHQHWAVPSRSRSCRA